MRLPTTLFLTLALLCPGCGKSEAEQQFADMTAKQQEVVSILKTVNDTESAKAANEKIKAVATDVQHILQRSKNIKTTEAQRKQLAEKYKPQLQQAGKDAQAELQRISKIPGASPELMDGLMQLTTAGVRSQLSDK